MKKIVYKLLVLIASLAVVAGILGTVFYVQDKKAKEEIARMEAEENASKEVAKAAMTEEEIQALYKEHRKEPVVMEEETETTVTEESAQESVQESTSEEVEEAIEESLDSPVDWEGIWEINEDVYAWITVPGTVIDYPILQHATDNTYYLNYNIDGSYGYPGCIYTENMNAKDFSDNNTVIYGHNMKNGSMFAGLHQYEERSFFDENAQVLIYTPEKEYEYTIFAAYIYDDRHLLYSFDFSNEEVYASYLDTVMNMRDLSANIRNDISVTNGNKIITLVTCMSNQPDKRLLVQAVLNE